eukprot:TRINITY_DN2247_c0_g1_i1.p1 TRINITY_DN2247_c0_g1~~TRINITY_DN2247_c0_g1_i1.p1  ORF type:complete len:330 (+),score=99.90 TRINITY_DN2247_c0_g1_i1:61-990(+)
MCIRDRSTWGYKMRGFGSAGRGQSMEAAARPAMQEFGHGVPESPDRRPFGGPMRDFMPPMFPGRPPFDERRGPFGERPDMGMGRPPFFGERPDFGMGFPERGRGGFPERGRGMSDRFDMGMDPYGERPPFFDRGGMGFPERPPFGGRGGPWMDDFEGPARGRRRGHEFEDLYRRGPNFEDPEMMDRMMRRPPYFDENYEAMMARYNPERGGRMDRFGGPRGPFGDFEGRRPPFGREDFGGPEVRMPRPQSEYDLYDRFSRGPPMPYGTDPRGPPPGSFGRGMDFHGPPPFPGRMHDMMSPGRSRGVSPK